MSGRVVVTGTAGFIGSQLSRSLVEDGYDVIASDFLTDDERWQNLEYSGATDLVDPARVAGLVAEGAFGPLDAVFHQGACSDTTERDAHYMMERNFHASVAMATAAVGAGVPFVYASSASVYGLAGLCVEGPENEAPLNVYAFSKLLFDRYARRHLLDAGSTVVGLRYFNVYGEREMFKGRMASVVHHFRRQIKDQGVVRLFDASGGYGPGEQRRDFVYVGDVIRVNRWFGLEAPTTRGIYNVGTGEARTFNDLANAVVAELGGSIEYIPFPDDLVGRYQHFTQADVTHLRASGIPDAPSVQLEDGVRRVIRYLEDHDAP